MTPHKSTPPRSGGQHHRHVGASPRWSLTPPILASHLSSPLNSPAVDVLDGGVAALAWAPQATSLVLCGASHAVQVLEVSLARTVHLPRVDLTSATHSRSAVMTTPPAGVLLAGHALLVAPPENEYEEEALAGSVNFAPAPSAGSPDAHQPPPHMGQPAALRSATQEALRAWRVLQCRAPAAYVAEHWPLTCAAVSHDGAVIAASGARGLLLCSWRASGGPSWRMFNDVAQERSLAVDHLAWLGTSVAVVTRATATKAAQTSQQRGRVSSVPPGAQLLVFPRNRLDMGAVQGRMDLGASATAAVVALDASPCGSRVAMALHDGKIIVLGCFWTKDTSARGITTSRVAFQRIHIVPAPHSAAGAALPAVRITLTPCGGGSDLGIAVLRTNGELSAVQLGACSGDTTAVDSRTIAGDVDAFWVPSNGAHQGAIDLPPSSGPPTWWIYGPQGMRLISPWPQQADAPAASLPVDDDPALAFDREAVPLSMSARPAAGLTWLTQRLSPQHGFVRADLPWFQPCPRAQPVLPCVLRHLLGQGKDTQAAELVAEAHRQGQPHLVSSLEWVLFTTLDAAVSRKQLSSLSFTSALGALSRCVALMSGFSEFPDVVVSVARKTDEREWRALFAATGSPSALFEACLASGRLRTAACYLLIIDSVEGAIEGQERALQLLQAALQSRSEYALAGELVRFLRRSGHEATLQSQLGIEEGDESAMEGQRSSTGGGGSLLYRSFSALFRTSSDSTAGLDAAALAREEALQGRVQAMLTSHGEELAACCDYRRLLALQRATHVQLSAVFKRVAHAAHESRVPQPLCATQDAFATALSCAVDAMGDGALPARNADCALIADFALRAGALDHAALCGIMAGAPGHVHASVSGVVKQALASTQLSDRARALLATVIDV